LRRRRRRRRRILWIAVALMRTLVGGLVSCE